MTARPVVVVIGRPNVGKSTLTNRILRRRLAVVDQQAGVTRDRRQFEAEWNGRMFLLVDTGGWELSPDEPLIAGVRGQTEAAVAAADVVIYLADATTQVTDDDQGIARLLLRSGVAYLFAANKVDGDRQEADLDHLWALGLGAPIPISAQHGRGVGDLLDRLVALLPEEGSTEPPPGIARLAIIGRPNVGKSTLLNKLAGEQRVLVDDQPGTTRDPIDMVVELDGEPFEIVDTAGIRRRARIEDDADFYAVLRARETIASADVALLVIDGPRGVTQQEQRLAEEIAEAGVGLIVLLNKWDAVDEESRAVTEDGVGDRLAFVSWAPVLRMSALTGSRIHRLPKAIRAVLEARRTRIPTPQLNRLIRSWQEAHPPPMRNGKRPRIIYAVQADNNPPRVVLFIRGGELGPDYLRFLENRLRDTFDLTGTPVLIHTRRRHSADQAPPRRRPARHLA